MKRRYLVHYVYRITDVPPGTAFGSEYVVIEAENRTAAHRKGMNHLALHHPMCAGTIVNVEEDLLAMTIADMLRILEEGL